MGRGFLEVDSGLKGDAHSGPWHRQVSLLALESIDKMKKHGLDLEYGDFAENLVVKGIELDKLPVGTILNLGSGAVLEVTQIGKDCHNSECAIKQQTGECVMPLEGIFAKVLNGGLVSAGDTIEVVK
ncbi:MOSC domain-containing protein [Candidatus Syntrophocurvum alkaliphilum]|nr:MOSC domain-containing protein [Candidatus Syntrophocurvum alkaliphilum]